MLENEKHNFSVYDTVPGGTNHWENDFNWEVTLISKIQNEVTSATSQCTVVPVVYWYLRMLLLISVCINDIF